MNMHVRQIIICAPVECDPVSCGPPVFSALDCGALVRGPRQASKDPPCSPPSLQHEQAPIFCGGSVTPSSPRALPGPGAGASSATHQTKASCTPPSGQTRREDLRGCCERGSVLCGMDTQRRTVRRAVAKLGSICAIRQDGVRRPDDSGEAQRPLLLRASRCRSGVRRLVQDCRNGWKRPERIRRLRSAGQNIQHPQQRRRPWEELR